MQVTYMIQRQRNGPQNHQESNARESAEIASSIEAIILKTLGFKRTAAALERQAEGTSRLVSFTQHNEKDTRN